MDVLLKFGASIARFSSYRLIFCQLAIFSSARWSELEHSTLTCSIKKTCTLFALKQLDNRFCRLFWSCDGGIESQLGSRRRLVWAVNTSEVWDLSRSCFFVEPL